MSMRNPNEELRRAMDARDAEDRRTQDIEARRIEYDRLERQKYDDQRRQHEEWTRAKEERERKEREDKKREDDRREAEERRNRQERERAEAELRFRAYNAKRFDEMRTQSTTATPVTTKSAGASAVISAPQRLFTRTADDVTTLVIKNYPIRRNEPIGFMVYTSTGKEYVSGTVTNFERNTTGAGYLLHVKNGAATNVYNTQSITEFTPQGNVYRR